MTHHVIDENVLSHMKPTAHMLNFARGEIVDGAALQRLYTKGHQGKYIADFPDEAMQEHPKFVCIPHLGASTEEAEDNCARMAAQQVWNNKWLGRVSQTMPYMATAYYIWQVIDFIETCAA